MQVDQRKLPALDGLRALAILLVIWHHFYLVGMVSHLDVGPGLVRTLSAMAASGVFLFFPLSGFLLFLPYARALVAGHPWPSTRQFYRRRVLRIFPVYLVALLTLMLGARTPLVPVTTPLLSFTLLFDWRLDAFKTVIDLDSPFWTLAIEWQFYLLLPWLALGLARYAGKHTGRLLARRLIIGLLSVIGIGLAIRLLAAWVYGAWGQQDPITAPGVGIFFALFYGIKGKYLEIFALGIAASLFYAWAVEQGHLPDRRRWALATGSAAVIGLAGCTAWAAAVGHLSDSTIGTPEWIFASSPGWNVLGEWATGFCFCCLLLAVLLGKGPGSLFSLAPLRFIGTISYSLYVWHWPLLLLCINNFSSYGQLILVGSLVILVGGTLSYFLIERPFLRYRRTAHRLRKMPAANEVAAPVQRS